MRFFNTSMIPIQITVKKDDGTEKELFAFQDNSGFVLTKKQLVDKENSLMEILEKAIEFYTSEEVEEWIDKTNTETKIELYSSMNFKVDFHKNEKGKFVIPKTNIKYKKFKPDLKRDWSFKCGWCGKKVSSKTDNGYFSIDFPSIPDLNNKPFERGCTEECATHIWKDSFKNWIHQNDYQDFFEV